MCCSVVVLLQERNAVLRASCHLWYPPISMQCTVTIFALQTTALHCTALHCTALHCTAITLEHTKLQYTTPHCLAELYTTLHPTVMHYTTPHCNTVHHTILQHTACWLSLLSSRQAIDSWSRHPGNWKSSLYCIPCSALQCTESPNNTLQCSAPALYGTAPSNNALYGTAPSNNALHCIASPRIEVQCSVFSDNALLHVCQ